MDKWALEEHARRAVEEAVSNHTVIVDVSLASTTPPDWGTGSLLKIKDRLFIGTCKHVVKPEYRNEDLRVLHRSAAAMKWTEKEKIKDSPLNKLLKGVSRTFSRKISVIERFYSDELDDLVLLELDPLSEGNTEGSQFLSVTDIKMPKVDMTVYLMGFSAELIKKATKQGDYGAFPYFEATKIVDVSINSNDFDSHRHFLTDFEITKNSVDPHGLSGCGVWTRLSSGENLWTPNLRLVGIQHGYYSKSEVLVATCAERLMKLV